MRIPFEIEGSLTEYSTRKRQVVSLRHHFRHHADDGAGSGNHDPARLCAEA